MQCIAEWRETILRQREQVVVALYDIDDIQDIVVRPARPNKRIGAVGAVVDVILFKRQLVQDRLSVDTGQVLEVLGIGLQQILQILDHDVHVVERRILVVGIKAAKGFIGEIVEDRPDIRKARFTLNVGAASAAAGAAKNPPLA